MIGGNMLHPRNERLKLAKLVENLYDVNMGAKGRLALLQRASLEQFASGLPMGSNARIFAGTLVKKVEDYGILSNLPEYHALGALISYILDMDENPDDAPFLAELIIKYSLVSDPGYISNLAAEHNVQVQIVRDIDRRALAPPQKGGIKQGPEFEPNIGDQNTLERVINSEDNFLDIQLLAGAIYSAQAVGRIEFPEGTAQGTGFLVAPNYVLTNQHVLKSKAYLEEAVIRFDYQIDASGVASKGRVFKFDLKFYESSLDTKLDYALVRLREEPLKKLRENIDEYDLPPLEMLRRGGHRGYLLLAPINIFERRRVNIIQHPDGNPQKVVLTQNYVVSDMNETRVQYLADTMEGSSGSPVFNKNWEVIALHHSGGPHPPDSLDNKLKKTLKGHFRINEGIPIRAILPEIQRYLA